MLLAGVAAVVALHVVFFLRAGGLWRDEVTSVNLARMPVGQAWQNLQYDSFPVLWSGLLRCWIACGLGSSDLGLRALGLLLGLGLLGALWRNARAFGTELPLVSLVLVGFNASVLAYGDSVRGYGLGMILGLLTVALAWELVEKPGPRTLVPFALVALASVHSVFHNAVLLLAAGAGGALVAARRRDGRALAGLAIVGVASALSLLLYRGMMRGQDSWVAIVRWSVAPSLVWKKFSEAAAETSLLGPWIWVVVALAALGVAVGLVRSRDLVLYSGTTLLVGIVAYLVFLLRLDYVMQAWYFLTLMVLVGSCAHAILGESLTGTRVRLARLVATALLMALFFPGVLRAARLRKTNVDQVAAVLASTATKDDLVVVFPWQAGITFARYWRGQADWVTVPPVSSHELHRYDLLKLAMMSPDVMQPVLDRAETTLRTGRRVFWVGDWLAPSEGERPPRLPPAPKGKWRWAEAPHYTAWVLQAGAVLRDHARSADTVPVGTGQAVSEHENLKLTVFAPR